LRLKGDAMTYKENYEIALELLLEEREKIQEKCKEHNHLSDFYSGALYAISYAIGVVENKNITEY